MASYKWPSQGGGGTGDIVGPSLSTNNALVRFDGTTGKLVKNSSVILTDGGSVSGIANLTVAGTTTLATSLSGVVKAASGVISASEIVNADISASAAIAYSKLALSNSIVDGDISASAAIGFSKLAALNNNILPVTNGSGSITSSAVTAAEAGYLSGVTSGIQAQIDSKQTAGNYITALSGDVVATGPGSAASSIQPGVIVNSMISASAAIAYSKLNLSNSIVNADIASSAAIAVSKLATMTASRALETSSGGVIQPSATTSTELGYLVGVTSAIQTQLDTKVTNPMTTGGDLIYSGAFGLPQRLANGTSGQVLTSAGGTSAPTWATITTNWTAYTPTISWVSNASASGLWRRVGPNMEIQIKVSTSGLPTATALLAGIPASYTIDTARLADASDMVLGDTLSIFDASNADYYHGRVYIYNNTTVGAYVYTVGTTYVRATAVTQTTPISFANGDNITFSMSVPITGWV